jgi:hypothetical protein
MVRFNTKQAAQHLTNNGVKYTPGSLDVMRSQGRGPKFYKHCRRIFYLQSDLDAFIGLAAPVETVDSMNAALGD